MSNSDISVPSQSTAATCMIESTPVRMVRNLKKRQSNCDDVKRMQSNGLIDDSDDDRKSSSQLLTQQQQLQAQQTLPPMGGFHRQPSSKPSTTSSVSMKSFTENPADFSNGNNSNSKQSVSARQNLDEAAKRSDHFSQQQQSSQQAPQQYKRRPQKTTQASTTLIQRKPSSQSQSDDNNSGDLPSASLSSNTSPMGNGGGNGDRDSTAAGTVQQSQTFSSRIDSLRVSVPLKSMVSSSQQQQQQMTLSMQQQQQEGPLGDKTNTLSEKRAFRRSKAKMPTTKDILATSGNSTHSHIINNNNNEGNNDLEYPDEKNQLQQYQRMASMGAAATAAASTANAMSIADQHIKEYVNIDIEYAVHFLVSKSKVIKEVLGGDNAIVARNAQNVIDSRIFKITYGAFIQKQVHRKVLSQDFRNVSKRAFEKLEKFVMAQIEKQQTKVSLQSTYVQSSKNVQSLFNSRIAALTKELADTKKLIFL